MWHKILKYTLYTIAGAGTGGLVASFFLLRDSYKRTYRRTLNRLFPQTVPDWKVAMTVYHPTIHRPRFLSLHTIAALTGRTDLKALAKEMKDSAEVAITFCTTVKAPVFHLFSHANHSDHKVWDQLDDFLERYPYPKFRGFKPYEAIWSSGVYGVGSYVPSDTGMDEPFVTDDYAYANKILDALEKHRYEPGIERYKIKKNKSSYPYAY